MITSLKPIRLPLDGIEEMCLEARTEGYRFLDRLQEDWESAKNRFDRPGEILLGCFQEEVLIGIGGVNRNLSSSELEIGRIRRVYVRPAWRKRGVGELLVENLLEKSRQAFRSVVLRTDNPNAARLYERLGFQRVATVDATHVLSLKP